MLSLLKISNPAEAADSSQELSIPVIGAVRSPYGDKFAVPRQSGLAAVRSYIEFYPPYGDPQAFAGIEGFSHLHVIFLFDKALGHEFRPMVRPPRLGGNKRMGVFATRSPFRPSHLGLSVVRLTGVRTVHGQIVLDIEGADMVDMTPVIDIKPYIPFVDAIPDAQGGFAGSVPPVKSVMLSSQAQAALASFRAEDREAVIQILQQDPRPAYKNAAADAKIYHARLFGQDMAFKVSDTEVTLLEVKPATEQVEP